MSSSRYANRRSHPTDESGDLAQALIERARGKVARRALLPDDERLLRAELSRALRERGTDVVVLTGGTGVSTTDVTVEAVRPFFEKEIEGFGELFRAASFKRVGFAAALSRATAGIAKGKVVVCLPGSPDAVRTALQLILPEVPHVLGLARGKPSGGPSHLGRRG